ncbi:MAG: hypothetical protein VB045_06000 [Synergistaceae bacterium]|nr:hypothetical protein [Synergistaceae bacterium]
MKNYRNHLHLDIKERKCAGHFRAVLSSPFGGTMIPACAKAGGDSTGPWRI